ncbi:hypothetical protein XB02_17895 [Pantoea ananatis]|nr:hypothetical protein XB02_17895 [Pantoea ananatis]
MSMSMRDNKISANSMIESVINDTKIWIKNNFYKDLNSNVVSSRSGYTRWYFQRSFSKKEGISLKNYIQKTRVEVAIHDIMHSDLSFNKISCSHGFNSVHTFLRAVKKIHGMTPSELRKHHQTEEISENNVP